MFSRFSRLKDERESGFTLIELLVVILIIGILAAIAIPMFLNQRKAAVDSTVKSDVSNAAKAIETWNVSQGTASANLPIVAADRDGVYTAYTSPTSRTPATNTVSQVLRDIKVSDGTVLRFSGTSYEYFIQGTNTGGDKSNATSVVPSSATNTGIVYASNSGGLK